MIKEINFSIEFNKISDIEYFERGYPQTAEKEKISFPLRIHSGKLRKG